MAELVGKVISVSELNVRILVEEGNIRIRNILYAEVRGKRISFEVAEEDGNVVSAIPLIKHLGWAHNLILLQQVKDIRARD